MTNEELLEKIVDAVAVKNNSLVLIEVRIDEIEFMQKSVNAAWEHSGIKDLGIRFLIAPDTVKITVVPPGKQNIEVEKK